MPFCGFSMMDVTFGQKKRQLPITATDCCEGRRRERLRGEVSTYLQHPACGTNPWHLRDLPLQIAHLPAPFSAPALLPLAVPALATCRTYPCPPLDTCKALPHPSSVIPHCSFLTHHSTSIGNMPSSHILRKKWRHTRVPHKCPVFPS